MIRVEIITGIEICINGMLNLYCLWKRRVLNKQNQIMNQDFFFGTLYRKHNIVSVFKSVVVARKYPSRGMHLTYVHQCQINQLIH